LNGRLTENVFKRISVNSTPNLSHRSNPNRSPSPNPKAQKPFWENEMTSFFEQGVQIPNDIR